MRFKPGQQVVCVKRCQWTQGGRIVTGINPKFNEIVTVSGYRQWFEPVIYLKEYPDPVGYVEAWFEPVISDSVIEKELESIPQFEATS